MQTLFHLSILPMRPHSTHLLHAYSLVNYVLQNMDIPEKKNHPLTKDCPRQNVSENTVSPEVTHSVASLGTDSLPLSFKCIYARVGQFL